MTRDELAMELPGSPGSAGVARREVSRFAAGDLTDARLQDAALLVSEVVTNAIVHGGGDDAFELRARLADDRLRVEVTNSGPGLAPEPRATEPSPDGGFGLFLVERLARRWGLVRHLGKTRVWFELETNG
jgi:anti-sigma regulatory factor (Ser/Thr protein kinase)